MTLVVLQLSKNMKLIREENKAESININIHTFTAEKSIFAPDTK